MREVETSEVKNEETDSTTIHVGIKYLTEPNQPKSIHFPFRTYGKKAFKGALKQRGSISSHGYIMTNNLTLYFVLPVYKRYTITFYLSQRETERLQ